jgi:hypothetical protein
MRKANLVETGRDSEMRSAIARRLRSTVDTAANKATILLLLRSTEDEHKEYFSYFLIQVGHSPGVVAS